VKRKNKADIKASASLLHSVWVICPWIQHIDQHPFSIKCIASGKKGPSVCKNRKSFSFCLDYINSLIFPGSEYVHYMTLSQLQRPRRLLSSDCSLSYWSLECELVYCSLFLLVTLLFARIWQIIKERYLLVDAIGRQLVFINIALFTW